MPVDRVGELEGLASMIAELIEGNLTADPERAKLLRGAPRRVRITAGDIGADVFLSIGNGRVAVSGSEEGRTDLWIYADAETLIDLPNAKLMMGLPSITDPLGRQVTKKLLTGKMKIRGMYRLGTLTKVQRLLSVT